MEKEYCVYMHVVPNGKRYIGQTCCSTNRRWQNGYGYVGQVFYNAIKKYGWDNIKHIIIADNLTLEEADRIERQYIDKYQTTDNSKGYNIDEGGHGGKHLTELHKQKISKANSGKNNGRYGYKYTDEERKYMSEHSVWRGRKHTEETRKKISDYMKAHPEQHCHYGADHPMARPVLQYDLDGNFIQQYITAAEASTKTGVSRSGICNCCKNSPKYKQSGGFIWKYKEDEIMLRIDPIRPNKRKKKIEQYAINGTFLRRFDSIREANMFIGVDKNNTGIVGVARGDRKTAHGYIWRYADGN